MEKQIKNTLNNIAYFLEWNKPIELQEDPGNDLGFFVSELNRYRTMLGLPLFEFNRRTKMRGRGTDDGPTHKVRFTLADEVSKDKSAPMQEAAPAETTQETTESLTPEGLKITRTKLKAKLEEHYQNIEVKAEKQDGVSVTLFLANDVTVGSWSKGRGWCVGV
jgi:hypothetical protein